MNILPIAKSIPTDVGPIHFIGIGGIGMSGIAEVLHNLGYTVRGSDLSENANVERLRGMGIEIHIGHKPEHVEEASVVVISSAVKSQNPEVIAARARMIPLVRRAEMLAELMRLKISVAVAGTHGKTTTTSMLAALFEAGKMDPTVINGGIINAYGTNAHLGKGEWMVVEADESDGTFTKLRSTVAVVTNMDPEHLDYYGDYDTMKAAYRVFLENIPFYGFAVLCIDHPEVQKLMGEVADRRMLAYGTNPQADIRAVNVSFDEGGTIFDVELSERVFGGERALKGIKVPMHGKHNLLNALAAIGVANELKFAENTIKRGFDQFQGVKRRFTVTGTVNEITVVDDYGHHPVEIAATLKAARQWLGKREGNVIAVVQPHRYSRLHDLYDQFCTCFNDADTVVVADVFPAGEEPMEGVNKEWLVQGLLNAGHRQAIALESEDRLGEVIAKLGGPGDIVVCLGAGSISSWAGRLPGKLKTLLPKSDVA